jgi:lipoprotein-releasing system ATP-binding protein
MNETAKPPKKKSDAKEVPAGKNAAPPAPPPALEMKGVERRFPQGEGFLEVLRGVDLTVRPGEIVSLIGPSGSGKSTLLHIAGLLENPDGGTIRINGRECNDLGDRDRTRLRRTEIGFVYQFHQLLPEFTALENVVLPQMIAGVPRRMAESVAKQLLAPLGLAQRLSHRPSELSGGEQQRVAIARALANGPKLPLADEPTGNLDPKTARGVLDELLMLVRQEGLAALIATHNPAITRQTDRVVALQEGRVVESGTLTE